MFGTVQSINQCIINQPTNPPQAGGAWLLSSHAPVDFPAVHAALSGCRALGQAGGSVTLKQEPLVLHVECRDVAAAERLLQVGIASGFRESGIGLGKKRVLAAIRTGANSLEVGDGAAQSDWYC
jgi:tRNA wybutosine-synthesizing protein 3